MVIISKTYKAITKLHWIYYKDKICETNKVYPNWFAVLAVYTFTRYGERPLWTFFFNLYRYVMYSYDKLKTTYLVIQILFKFNGRKKRSKTVNDLEYMRQNHVNLRSQSLFCIELKQMEQYFITEVPIFEW